MGFWSVFPCRAFGKIEKKKIQVMNLQKKSITKGKKEVDPSPKKPLHGSKTARSKVGKANRKTCVLSL